MSAKQQRETTVDAVIVGAGFSGLYLLHRFRKLGLTTRVLERGGGVGGWYWNRYPGARCDAKACNIPIPSTQSSNKNGIAGKFSAQPDILAYATRVADRFDLRKDIDFDVEVKAAHFNETTRRWQIETDKSEDNGAVRDGDRMYFNRPNAKDRRFKKLPRQYYHTSNWPHEKVDFTGRGSPSSAQGRPATSNPRIGGSRPRWSFSGRQIIRSVPK